MNYQSINFAAKFGLIHEDHRRTMFFGLEEERWQGDEAQCSV